MRISPYITGNMNISNKLLTVDLLVNNFLQYLLMLHIMLDDAYCIPLQYRCNNVIAIIVVNTFSIA